jgi:hypothetical protein
MTVQEMSQLSKGDKANFETLKRAFGDRSICLMWALRKSDGKEVALVCAVNHHSEFRGSGDECDIVPLAVMIEGNPFEDFVPCVAEKDVG